MTVLPDDMHLPSGTRLLNGQYTIVQVLGQGGFGITYRVTQHGVPFARAIKECFPIELATRRDGLVVPHSSNLADVLRLCQKTFQDEVTHLARLSHPAIVPVLQVFPENGTIYMVQDFISGTTLEQHIRNVGGRLEEPALLCLLRPILDALHLLHSEGILHRDIAPDNILIRPDGSPVLIDFGAARQVIRDGSRHSTGLRSVKDSYSPHEFYVRGARQGWQSDLYSLAATLYRALSGHPPPSAELRAHALASGDADPYQPLSGPSTPLRALVDAGMTHRLDARPADVAVWRRRLGWADQDTGAPNLQPVLPESIPSVRPGPSRPEIVLRKAGGGRRLIFGLGVALASALIAIAALRLPLPVENPATIAASPAPRPEENAPTIAASTAPPPNENAPTTVSPPAPLTDEPPATIAAPPTPPLEANPPTITAPTIVSRTAPLPDDNPPTNDLSTAPLPQETPAIVAAPTPPIEINAVPAPPPPQAQTTPPKLAEGSGEAADIALPQIALTASSPPQTAPRPPIVPPAADNPPARADPPPPIFNGTPKELIEALQGALDRHNCKPGPVDGSYGLRSARATILYNLVAPASCGRLNELDNIGASAPSEDWHKGALSNLATLDACNIEPACGVSPEGEFLREFTTGCWYEALNAHPNEYATWDGACDAEGFISGYGKLTFSYPVYPGDTFMDWESGTYLRGRKETGEYSSALLDGRVILTTYSNGKRNGPWSQDTADGDVKVLGNYLNDERDGVWTQKGPDGYSHEVEYDSGKARRGVIRQVFDEGKYSKYEGGLNDRLQKHGFGTLIYYDADDSASMMLKGGWRNGEKHGILGTVMWNREGTVAVNFCGEYNQGTGGRTFDPDKNGNCGQ